MNPHAALSFLLEPSAPWRADWIWGCPLILLTVIVHVLGLGYVSQRAALFGGNGAKRHAITRFTMAIGATTLLAIIFHAIEVGIWAIAYLRIGALPNFKTAMLFSLGAMTTFGHANIFLTERWQLLGGMEALNGWLLFGLSSAFLFWLMQQIAPRSPAGLLDRL
jgi:hypothetical protein